MTTNHSELPAEKVAAAIERLRHIKIEDGDLLVLPVDMERDASELMVPFAASLQKAIEGAMERRVTVALLPNADQLRRFGRAEGIEYLERCLAELRS